MKRLCIFCFYDSKGIVDNSVEYLLGELALNSDRVIVVINGEIDNYGKKLLKTYSNDIIIRENAGFDAGAYKYVMFKYLNVEIIRQYDELILCNDTFIGPFISLENIFSKMEKKECDFWGLNGVNWKFMPAIQSYFMVFNKSIIQDNEFFQYWSNNIDEYTNSLEDVYAQFETGLFYYLTDIKNKKYAVYVNENNCNIYKSVSVSVKKYGIPLIKKKALKNYNINHDDIIDAVQYIYQTDCYPIENIIDYIKRFCDVKITKDQILDYMVDKNKIVENSYIEVETTTQNVKKRIDESKGFYIYGCGVWARKIYWNLCRNNYNFKGFLVSDITKLKYKKLYNFDVVQIDKADINEDSDIVLGVNKENAIEIVSNYLLEIDIHRIISLFPDTIMGLY